MSGPQELHLIGTNLTPRDVQLVHDGIAYTPLASSQSDWMYLLGGNGTNVITVGGRWLFTIVVSDVVVPEGVPFLGRLSIQSNENYGYNAAETKATIYAAASDCLNLAAVSDDNYNFVQLSVSLPDGGGNPEAVGYAFNNFSFVKGSESGGRYRMILIVSDQSKPAFVMLDGYIIAVTNYSS